MLSCINSLFEFICGVCAEQQHHFPHHCQQAAYAAAQYLLSGQGGALRDSLKTTPTGLENEYFGYFLRCTASQPAGEAFLFPGQDAADLSSLLFKSPIMPDPVGQKAKEPFLQSCGYTGITQLSIRY